MKSTTPTATEQSKVKIESPAAISTDSARVVGRPFVKGVSGNPSGRPKKLPITDALREELAKRGNHNVRNDIAIARILVKMAIAGDAAAIREIADRVEGKARQRTEISGPDGAAIPFDLPDTREGLERRIAELLKG